MDNNSSASPSKLSSTIDPFSDSVHLIVAMGKDGAIGKNGDLIWKISQDLRHFKDLTSGHPVIMGRKTWDSLPKKPLPNRRNIILTRKQNIEFPGAEVVNSVEEAIQLTKGQGPFIIGGAEIYNAFMPYVSHFHITKIFDSCPDADVFLNLPSDLELISSSPVIESLSLDTPTPSFQFLTFTTSSSKNSETKNNQA